MAERDNLIERVVETLKEPVAIDPSFDARVMSEIEQLPAPGASPTRRLYEWLRRTHTIRVSPIGGLAVAAGLAAVVIAGNMVWRSRTAVGPLEAPAAALQTTIQFVFVAAGAGSVTVVGDFNDWDVSATPLVRSEGDGVWAVTVPLAPGRYRYSFLVDGTTWLSDPLAVRAVEDEFGRPNSVLTIGGA